MRARKFFVASAFTVGASIGFVPSLGAQPVEQSGLVNVNAQDTTIQVPVAVAANICGVDVNVLASNIADAPVECTADGVSIAQDSDRPGGPVSQDGLVNVNLQDTTVQVPVAIAADICGVDANVLAQEVGDAPATCTAGGAAEG